MNPRGRRTDRAATRLGVHGDRVRRPLGNRPPLRAWRPGRRAAALTADAVGSWGCVACCLAAGVERVHLVGDGAGGGLVGDQRQLIEADHPNRVRS